MKQLYALPPDYRHRLMLIAVLALSSLMSVSMVLFRILVTGSHAYIGFVWNLFLAWIPLASALVVWRLGKGGALSRLLIAGLFVCWLAFFPNAPYMVTDLIHLYPREGISIWFDLMLVFSFAWNALVVGFVSLRILQHYVEWQYGKLISWGFVIFALGAASFGVYLGRFLRWNSWDILSNPRALLYDVAIRLLDPLAHPKAYAFTLLVGGFLVLAYATVNLMIETNWRYGEAVSTRRNGSIRDRQV